MPIMGAHGQNDARIAARLLATTAVDCLRDPALAREGEVALNNVYRLLESFRRNPFFGHEAPARGARNAAETLAFGQPMERHVREVRRALDKAMGATFGNQPREDSIELIERVLRGVAFPREFGEPARDEIGKVTSFFEEVLKELRLA